MHANLVFFSSLFNWIDSGQSLYITHIRVRIPIHSASQPWVFFSQAFVVLWCRLLVYYLFLYGVWNNRPFWSKINICQERLFFVLFSLLFRLIFIGMFKKNNNMKLDFHQHRHAIRNVQRNVIKANGLYHTQRENGHSYFSAYRIMVTDNIRYTNIMWFGFCNGIVFVPVPKVLSLCLAKMLPFFSESPSNMCVCRKIEGKKKSISSLSNTCAIKDGI